MRFGKDKKGFSTVEIITVVAIISILLTMVIGVGKHITTQGNEELAQSTIGILVTAVEQYYAEEGNFPFVATVGVDFDVAAFGTLLGGAIAITAGTHDETDWSSEALYYTLSGSLNSKRIINAITDSMVTTRDSKKVVVKVTVAPSATPHPMPRFIDPWGNSFIYRYDLGDSFCSIGSAGRDGVFGTGDDLSNRE